ncbi:MAG: TIGR04551 family protein [Polyangiaceae bacterium]
MRMLRTCALVSSLTAALAVTTNVLAQPATPAPDQPAPAPPPGDKLLPDDAPPPTGDKKPEDKKPEDKKPEDKKPEDKKPGDKDEKAKPKGDGTESDTDVFAEQWWTSARPTVELHGYYRLRSQLYSHFALGRTDTAANVLWPQPTDNDYNTVDDRNKVVLCGDNPLKPEPCENNIQAGANMRFRINPELHISDNVRIMAQIDLLDNLVLGSTPDGFANQPGTTGGYDQIQRGGYSPTGAFATTQFAPVAGVNSLTDSVTVKRVWGEYQTPIGLLRFGRMPSQWGLGMLANAGDGYDSDNGSTADRLLFVTGIKKWDLYFGALWDFVNEGPTSGLIGQGQGQSYDLAQSDDVNQWGVIVVRRRNPELQKLELAQNKVVINGGFYGVYRNHSLEYVGQQGLGASSRNYTDGYLRRGAEAFIPDFWFQFLWKKLRIEAEAAFIAGSIENPQIQAGSGTNYKNANVPDGSDDGWGLLSFGLAVQAELRAVEDKLHRQLDFGYATGDQDVEGLAPTESGLDPQLTHDRTFSTFRFHPDFRVDYILWRSIFNRVQGAYYFKPTVEYDFTRSENGQRIGGGGSVIWSRASQPIQAPGNDPDLGVELDFQLYYQAKDGTLNDDLSKIGGFYTAIQYGVMFPLGGLGYLTEEKKDLIAVKETGELSTAQMLRWYLGIMF